MTPKVVIHRDILSENDNSDLLQHVATVFWGIEECRVYAPSRATGRAIEWHDQFLVHSPSGIGSETDVTGELRTRTISLTRIALQDKENREEPKIAMSVSSKADPRKVFVVYGRNSAAHEAMFAFLRALDLAPMEWGEVIASTGEPTPFTGVALDSGFSVAQAAVVLLTGDDLARAGKRYLQKSDGVEERVLTPQPRPNVLFEAGMALGKYPERTVIVAVGQYRKFSDIDGRHIVHLSNSSASRQSLLSRLKLAGCPVKEENKTDWLKAGDFDAAIKDPDIIEGQSKFRLKLFSREAKEHLDATFKRKIWIELRNESDECLRLSQPAWRPGSAGIQASVRQGTFQLQLGSTWCPEKIGAPQINLPPGELCRLWIEPDKNLTMDYLRQICQSEQPLGALTMIANTEEITVQA
jgi:predicted nucleotide-binding protein